MSRQMCTRRATDAMLRVPQTSTLQEQIALRLFIFFEPYLVEQERMANAQLLMYGSKHLDVNSQYPRRTRS
jgi:hypothetical protein